MSGVGIITSMNMPENQLNLTRLVNLALSSSPKVGIVNFNLLKTVLLELIKALNLQHFEPKFGEDAQTLVEDALKNETQHEEILNLINSGDKSDSTASGTADGENGKSGTPNISILTADGKPITLERFHRMEGQLARLEQQMGSMNALPTNQQLIDKTRDAKKLGAGGGPILEIWQYTQLSKRVESNEEGITKLTSLIQDLIGDMNELKEGQTKNVSEIKSLNDLYKELNDRIKSLEKMRANMPSMDQIRDLENMIENLRKNFANMSRLDERIDDLSKKIKEIEEKILQLVIRSELDIYVTWPALENCLKGLKDALDRSMNKELDIKQTQTTPLPPKDSRPTSSADHPSKELQEILLKLGTLNDRHEALKELVELLKSELEKNAGSGKVPEDILQRLDEIKRIKAALEELKNNLAVETNRRLQLEGIINNINNEMDNLRNSIKECLKSTQLNKEEIENLKKALQALDEAKGDKDWVRSELDKKADKKDLDKFVSRKLFDETTTEMSNNINSALQKVVSLDEELKKATENIYKELENKLDRQELDALKEYIEKTLKKLKRMQKESAPQVATISAEDEAAGLRKQLLRFHCISCDRPIEMLPHQTPIPTLPADRGLRPIQTPRPYTTYELDQIRQFQKQQLIQDNNYEIYTSFRQCGGPHTLTVPHKKHVKVSAPGQGPIQPVAVEEPAPVPHTNQKSEVSIVGQDGHVYKGRIDARLAIEMKKPIRNLNQKSAHMKSVADFSNYREDTFVSNIAPAQSHVPPPPPSQVQQPQQQQQQQPPNGSSNNNSTNIPT